MVISPTFTEEKKFWQQGYQHIAGIDEAGCGCWAGPLVCGVVILPPEFRKLGIRDSKQLTSKRREEFYDIIKNNASAWSVGQASEKEIDDLGLVKAKNKAVQRAISTLNLKPEYLLMDNNIDQPPEIPASSFIKGDANIISIACASIKAKVTRDNIITELDKDYPGYGFAKNKGYGTKEHQEALQKHGVCAIHRKSYKPVAKMLTGNIPK